MTSSAPTSAHSTPSSASPGQRMRANLMRTKSVEQSIADTEHPEYTLNKKLGWLDLTVFGVGVVVGAGIFTLTGRAAHSVAGPSIVISFVIAAIACALAAMCYAEFASTVPVAGSAYTFSYAAVGELLAWIIGWDLMLEMFLGAAVVAQGWSAYVSSLLDQLTAAHSWWQISVPAHLGYGGTVDLVAMGLVLVLGVLVAVGIKESMRVNLALVALKLFIVLFVIIAGLQFINPSNYSPFIPDQQPTASSSGLHQPLMQLLTGSQATAFGVSGILTGAALVFFAYIGFDVVATAAEETRRPQRDLPIGIIASLVICTVLYCAVALVVTGMVSYEQLSPKASLAEAFAVNGRPGMAILISTGAVAGLTTVVLTLMIGASRLIFAMARDGLLPAGLAKVHPRFRTPWLITAIVTVITALLAGLTEVGILEEMVNIGTLSAFVMVSIGVIVLRRKRPDLRRGFRVPFSPVLPALSALICTYLMLNLSIETWLRFLVWLALGLGWYAVYGYRKSRLATTGGR